MSTSSPNQPLPHNPEAEASVLGALLLDNHIYADVQDLLTPESFYTDAHQRIYRAIVDIISKGQPADLVTVVDHLKSSKELTHVGGPASVAQLAQETATAVTAKSHALIVREYAARRALMAFTTSLHEAAQHGEDVGDLLSQSQTRLGVLCQAYVQTDFIPAKELARSAAAELADRVDRKVHYVGLPSGYGGLDEHISGFGPGHLVIIGGLTGMGKTSLLLDFIQRLCIEQSIRIALFSLEMSELEVLHRLASKVSQVPCWRIQQAELSHEDLSRVLAAIGHIGEAGFFMDATSALTLTQLQAKLRRIVAKERIQLAIVDYIQLVSNKQKYQSRQEELASVAQGLKQIARELSIAILCGAQLNSEASEHPRPKLEHIRESRVIVHEADSVLFINRLNYGRPEVDDPSAELIVAKARHGRTGIVRLVFDERTVSFVEPGP